MKRVLAALGLAWVAVAIAGSDDILTLRVLDLNAPGALEALRRENPVHYRKLQQILNGLTDRPQEDIPNWIQTNFAARDVDYSLHLLTSEPPKRHLKLNLDDTRYEAVVTLRSSGGTISPMK